MAKNQSSEKEHETICVNCKKATGGCSWSKKFEPVDGWNAIPTKIKTGYKYGGKIPHIVDSFDVYECPEFELLKMQKAEIDRAEERKWLKLLMEVDE
jgi:hypothetical protein